MPKHLLALLLMVFCSTLMGACSTSPALLHEQSQASLDDFEKADPSLNTLLSSSYAYVIFPRITNGAFILGGAHGDGEVYKGGQLNGTADVAQGNVGLQAGAQRFAELVIFRSETTYVNFTNDSWEFDARASAIAISSGSAGTADYSRGVLVFTMQEGGLMAQAALGLQKFTYHPPVK